MKFSSLLAALLLISTSSFASIWRVNNNPSSGANFSTINDAIQSSGVLNNDTLHIESSGVSYSAFTLTKKLVLIGTGYMLGQRPGYQASASASTINGTCYISTGSDGSVIQGIDFISGGLNITVSNTIVTRNKFAASAGVDYYSNANNSLFLSNWGGNIYTYGSPINIVLRNSYLYSTSFSGTSQINMEHCYLYSGSYSTSTGVYKNNIFASSQVSAITVSSVAIFSNNVFYTNPFASTNLQGSNLVSVPFSSIFSSVFDQGNQSTLEPIPSAITNSAGENGVDIGIYGGPTPYIKSGIPPIPTIYQLNVPAAASGNLPITIGIRSNN
jgi:hypothetical protein